MAGHSTIRLEGKVAVAGAAEHPHAARRLQEAFPAIDWYPTSANEAPAGDPLVRLRRNAARPEGAFALSVDDRESRPTIEIAGGPFSGVIYGVEELLQRRATAAGRGADVQAGTVEQAPALPYRTY
jgi:hypothetical protein